jgi:uncharacterized damage-inducible protein DinB
MSWLDHYRTMARYNRWMNDKLYAASATLSDQERKRDRGAFFKSIHGTLNHVLLGDSIWLSRFKQDPHVLPQRADGQPIEIVSLAQEVYESFDALTHARRHLDARIEAWIVSLDEDTLASELTYKTVTQGVQSSPFWASLSHFFNHQTHHRGQVTTLLTQAGVDVGVTDLIMMVRQDRDAVLKR